MAVFGGGGATVGMVANTAPEARVVAAKEADEKEVDEVEKVALEGLGGE